MSKTSVSGRAEAISFPRALAAHFSGWARILASLACLFTVAALALATPAALGATSLDDTPPGDGLFAVLHTSKGRIMVRLFFRRAPLTVMNFVGLAEGGIEWRDPKTGERRKTPLYRNLTFHRVRDFMIQTGDPTGTGTGGAGYTFADEFHPDLRHDRPGIVSMANRGPNTNSSQFFITKRAAPWLNDHYTVFGEVVAGMEVVKRIRAGDKLEKVVILRKGSEARAFSPKMAHQLAKRRLAELKERAKKNLPPDDEIGPPDPARVPKKGQPLKTPGSFEFIVIGHTEIRGLERLGKVFYYDRKGALEVARKITRMARARGADFAALARRYTDMPHNWRAENVSLSPLAPAALERIFHLRPGQVSDPVDLPTGVYVFHRLR